MTLFPGVALVTGAASGIGRATAVSFALEGCSRIAIIDRNRDGLHETEKLMREVSPHTEILIQVVDMLEEEQIDEMVHECVAKWGRVDYCVNAAGILGNNAPSTSTSSTQFDLINSINYRGTWLCSRAQLSQMTKQDSLPSHDGRPGNRGSIVNIASQLGVVSRRDAPAYCASKAAVISLTKSDAIDYSSHNIRVNCVCPGVIATPMTQSDPSFAAALGPAIAIAPMNRMGTAQEVADACLFLSSSKASFVQGHALTLPFPNFPDYNLHLSPASKIEDFVHVFISKKYEPSVTTARITYQTHVKRSDLGISWMPARLAALKAQKSWNFWAVWTMERKIWENFVRDREPYMKAFDRFEDQVRKQVRSEVSEFRYWLYDWHEEQRAKGRELNRYRP